MGPLQFQKDGIVFGADGDGQISGELTFLQMQADESLVHILLCPVVSVSQMGKQDLHQTQRRQTASLRYIYPPIGLPEIGLADIQPDPVCGTGQNCGHIAVAGDGAVGQRGGGGLLRGGGHRKYVLTHIAVPPNLFLSNYWAFFSFSAWSAVARASMISSRLPSMTASILYSVSPTRWSVTRPWGKL